MIRESGSRPNGSLSEESHQAILDGLRIGILVRFLDHLSGRSSRNGSCVIEGDRLRCARFPFVDVLESGVRDTSTGRVRVRYARRG